MTASAPDQALAYDRSTAMKNVDQNEEILVALIEVFHEEAAEMRDTINDAIRRGDVTLLQRAAHTLKSSCAALGAEPSRALCEKLENGARDGDLTAAPDLVSRLETELDRLKAALESAA